MSNTILVTGAAGFIGSHLAQALVRRGDTVVGLDNFNDYYDPDNKRANVDEVRATTGDGTFELIEGDIRDRQLVAKIFDEHRPDAVAHLAAMAGVRVSIDDPYLYYSVNLDGTLTLLEGAVGRLTGAASATPPRFVFASTSSVYGATERIPFVESDPCDRPLAPYPASKRAAEMLGHTYHHLYGIEFTVLRFFTVYGPRGRPDMMAYKVADNLFKGQRVELYNDGQMYRDWTYIDDIVSGVVAAIDRPLGFDVINLGRGEPVLLADFVRLIEELTGQSAQLDRAPMPPADVAYTYADIAKARDLLGYHPAVSVPEGVARFMQWYASRSEESDVSAHRHTA